MARFDSRLKAPWGWQLIDRQDASSSSDLNFEMHADYIAFEFIGTDLDPATDDVELWCRISDDARATYEAGTSDYSWSSRACESTTTPTDRLSGDNADAQIVIISDDATATAAVGNADDEGCSFRMWVCNHASASLFTMMQWQASWNTAAATSLAANCSGSGQSEVSVADDGIQFLFESGNINAGTIIQLGLIAPTDA